LGVFEHKEHGTEDSPVDGTGWISSAIGHGGRSDEDVFCTRGRQDLSPVEPAVGTDDRDDHAHARSGGVWLDHALGGGGEGGETEENG
jgi:hypothetical protein